MQYTEPENRVGFTYINKVGEVVEVVEYKHNKDVMVEFDDGLRVKTTWMYIKEGRPLHPTRRKIKVGDAFNCKDGDVVTVVEKHSPSSFTVSWKSDGTLGKTTAETLKTGILKHPTKDQPLAGTTWNLSNGHTAFVTAFNNSKDVDIVFEDGVTAKTTAADLRKGSVGHPTSGLYIGQKLTTNSGWNCEVLKYHSCHDVEVLWQDGSTSHETAAALKSGSIKPAFQPSVCDVGYFGVGRWTSFGGENPPPEKIYNFWVRMISRCYSPKELNKDKGAAYRDVFVCEDWHNFQNFGEWCINQPNWSLPSMELDKDLFGDSKSYAPDNCYILHTEVNKFLMSSKEGKYRRGVHIISPKTPNSAVGYVARCSFDGDRGYLGFYPTEDAAFRVYKARKEEIAKILADRHKGTLSERGYKILYNYEVKE